LSEEVGRLARTLDALTQRARASAAPSFDLGPRISDRPSDYIGMPAIAPIGTAAQKAEPEPITLNAVQVRDLLRARRMRADFLPGDLFADPAWDMLLDLLAARLEQERVSVSSLCIAAAVPPTTALRWIRTLTEKGLVLRQADPHDGRRVFITLAQETADALLRWFGASRRLINL
jgi:DNA-binding transcriptional ArsR family regulator